MGPMRRLPKTVNVRNKEGKIEKVNIDHVFLEEEDRFIDRSLTLANEGKEEEANEMDKIGKKKLNALRNLLRNHPDTVLTIDPKTGRYIAEGKKSTTR